MPAARILVVEDSEAIRLALATALGAQGFDVDALPDGERLEERLATAPPDLVLLDVMLPGRDGFALLAQVRRRSRAAVLMVTARDALADRVHGLQEGADDYLAKPFAMAELVARCHALIRRVRPGGVETQVDDLVLDAEAARVSRDGRPLELTVTERRLLAYLAAHREQVVSKTQILTAVWGYEGFDPNVVEVHVSSLRRKLEVDGGTRLVHTVRGVGYRLAESP